tara:strand:- start:469 stop:768 length:300 start_codon:yes stop_codon:yes gene_type:complete
VAEAAALEMAATEQPWEEQTIQKIATTEVVMVAPVVEVVELETEVLGYSLRMFIQVLEMVGMLVKVLAGQLSHRLVLVRMVVVAAAQAQQDLVDLAASG